MDVLTDNTISEFFRQNASAEFESTSAEKVTYSRDLYNVKGSTPDPKIGGKKWKKLLKDYNITGRCYVTNQKPPSGTSHEHAEFDVGGHVTPNQDGIVNKGQSCYLMPLCTWHNSTSRDGKNFEHSKTSMLKLNGYMQGEPPETFLARMPSAQPYSLIFRGEGDWHAQNLSGDSAEALLAGRSSNDLPGAAPTEYVLLKRVTRGDRQVLVVEENRLT